jgi:hypothetical protein
MKLLIVNILSFADLKFLSQGHNFALVMRKQPLTMCKWMSTAMFPQNFIYKTGGFKIYLALHASCSLLTLVIDHWAPQKGFKSFNYCFLSWYFESHLRLLGAIEDVRFKQVATKDKELWERNETDSNTLDKNISDS